MKALSIILLGLAWLSCLGGPPRAGGEEVRVERSRPMMGTMVAITVLGPDRALCDRAVEQAFQKIETVDRLMSVFKEDSQVSQLNRSAGKAWVALDPPVLEVLEAAVLYARLSEGAFDITVGPLLRLWGFYREKGHLPSPQEIRRARSLVDYREIEIDRPGGRARLKRPGMAIDLGGIAKGYAVDKAVEALKKNGIQQGLVNTGDLYAFGGSKEKGLWRIGLQHPREREKIVTLLEVADRAVATSGNYERYFVLKGKRYAHIFDPRTGWPTQGMASVTILADRTMAAEALAVSVFVLGVQKGLALVNRLPGVEAIVIAEEGPQGRQLAPYLSKGLQGRISLRF
ncbi:MAG: FAD:protein FMN transferase [Candidatus Tectomicrobia bacterium]|uniref:FAD:protein FMN transferase n=1 Tax=Tectimicrobiota bacterium TaxID=2528274 RepID=A0A932CNC8_UNCTE|nr:FAD:protein FMN transferase [Candidatus Tectomicrobia bacterium]